MDSSKRFHGWQRWLRFLLVLLISFGCIVGLNNAALQHTLEASIAQEVSPSTTPKPSASSLQPSPIASPSPQPVANPALQQLQQLGTAIAPKPVPKLNHFPYPQADPNTLITVGHYGQRIERLAPEAAIAWQKMVSAAREEKVYIIPISGFRSVAEQTQLFNARVRRWGSQIAAAKVIAPPGYSEHHTGYVMDLGDGRARNLDVTTAFARSSVYKWMQKHGKEFGFELSFPQNNFQKISYEPWHWRFVGSPAAMQLFAAGRPQAMPVQPNQMPLLTPQSRSKSGNG